MTDKPSTILNLTVEDGRVKYCAGEQTCIHEYPVTAGQCGYCSHLLENAAMLRMRSPLQSPYDYLKVNADYNDKAFTRPAATGGANTEWDGKETVVHPLHYNQHPSGVECWDIAQYYTFNVGTVFKHLWRAGLKDTTPEGTLEDHEKALQYLQKEINRLSELINQTFTVKPKCKKCNDTGWIDKTHTDRERCNHG